jgi:hypothetical protein
MYSLDKRGVSMKTKNIKIEDDLIREIEVLCEVLHTNFSVKTKELLTEWQIERLAYLKANSPEKFQEYLDKIQAKK